MADLQTRQATAALALELAILTAARSGEVLGGGGRMLLRGRRNANLRIDLNYQPPV